MVVFIMYLGALQSYFFLKKSELTMEVGGGGSRSL